MPRKKTNKKIINQTFKKQTIKKQPTKLPTITKLKQQSINITIDNSKKTTRNSQEKKPLNNNAYHTVPSYHIFYNEPTRPLMESKREENLPNPLANPNPKTNPKTNTMETQTDPLQSYTMETQTPPLQYEMNTQTDPIQYTMETQTDPINETPKKVRIKVKIPNMNFKSPSQENNLSDYSNDGKSYSFSQYANIPARRTMTPRKIDDLSETEKPNEIIFDFPQQNIEKLMEENKPQINPLIKKGRGRPKKEPNAPKSTYNKKSTSRESKPF